MTAKSMETEFQRMFHTEAAERDKLEAINAELLAALRATLTPCLLAAEALRDRGLNGEAADIYKIEREARAEIAKAEAES